METRQGVVAQAGHDPGLHVRRGAQVERDVPRPKHLEQRLVLDRGHAVRDATHAEVEHLAHALGILDFARMCGERQTGLACGDEGERVWRRRPRSLVAGEIETDDWMADLPGRPRQRDVGGGGMAAHRGHDEPYERHARAQNGGAPGDRRCHGLDHDPDREAAFGVQSRRPPDFGVSDAIGQQIVDELGGHALERLGRLEQRDRQVKELEQRGLVLATLGPDHSGARLLKGQRQLDGRRELDGGLRAHRPVQVLVQLCLGKGPEVVNEGHARMIGIRAVLALGLATIGLATMLGPGWPDPGIGLAAQRLVIERAGRADAALAALEQGVAPGLEAARQASARVVTGDEEPGPLFRTAAVLLTDLDASDVRDAVTRLDGARQAAMSGAPVVATPVDAGEIASIAAQLHGTADAADAFVTMRRRAERVTGTLDEALRFLERGEADLASERVAAARGEHDIIAGWEVGLPTLPVWIGTVDAMIGAMERLVAATQVGNREGAAAAASDVAAVADDAAMADRALRIAIGEGGASIASTPLGRLADLLGRVRDARAEMAMILQTAGR